MKYSYKVEWFEMSAMFYLMSSIREDGIMCGNHGCQYIVDYNFGIFFEWRLKRAHNKMEKLCRKLNKRVSMTNKLGSHYGVQK
jgi:hypothetical protein